MNSSMPRWLRAIPRPSRKWAVLASARSTPWWKSGESRSISGRSDISMCADSWGIRGMIAEIDFLRAEEPRYSRPRHASAILTYPHVR
ncbi:unannotated protein [freshwater metagenome]|uniref:Unannotated protein n=1 Tax=freshwater metagenome TaxID=449393 RepID=A0A6J7JMC3_9ZZZZ